MATATPTTAPDPARVAAIADLIRQACSPVLGLDANTSDAKAAAKDASDAASGGREAIMVTLANLSHTQGWTDGEIRAAAGKAANMSNNSTEKALATFIGETKRAMHPSVCAHVPMLVALRDQVWDDETAAYNMDKATPTPIRKAFIRKYHMMITMFGEAADGNLMHTPDLLLDYAVTHNPDIDAAKVIKKIEKARADIGAIYANFPLDALQVAMQNLDDITKKALEAVAGGVTAPTVVQRPLPPLPQSIKDKLAAVKALPDVSADTTGGAADGAFDLDDILGHDPVDLRAAA